MTGAAQSESTSLAEPSGRPHAERRAVLAGRYTLLAELASGGMATVHLARQEGAAGFGRIVVLKRLHPQFAKSPEFVCMLLDEARLASRVRHPNVVPVTDVVAHEGELLLAMEYVDGLSLSHVRKALGRTPLPLSIVSAIGTGLLTGLHAAHQALGENGEPLRIVHRDVSPQNVMLGVDGVVRVVDFGIASATERLQTTAEGQIKGKLSYMAPEQARTQAIDLRADLFSAGVVLWELLTGKQFAGGTPEQRLHFILNESFVAPSMHRAEGGEVPSALDAVILRALSREPDARFDSAEAMTEALLAAQPAAHALEVSQWLKAVAAPLLAHRRLVFADAESEARSAVAWKSSAATPLGVAGSASPSERDSALKASRGRFSLLGLVTGAGLVAVGLGVWLGARYSDDADTTPLTESGVSLTESGVSLTESSPSLTGSGVSLTESSPSLTGGSSPVTSRVSDLASGVKTSPSKPSVATTKGTSSRTKSSPAVEAGSPTASQQTRPAAKTQPAPATPVCSPPYELLEGGFKRYKPECL